MPKPKTITQEDLDRWNSNIDNDPWIAPQLVTIPIMREVCCAGLWLAEQLAKSGCPDILIPRIQWTAGKLSFGRDVWDVHQDILQKYQDNELIFEEDPDEIKN